MSSAIASSATRGAWPARSRPTDVLPAGGGDQAAAVGGGVGAHLQVGAVGRHRRRCPRRTPPSPGCRRRRRSTAKALRSRHARLVASRADEALVADAQRRLGGEAAARACPPASRRTGRPRRAMPSARAPAVTRRQRRRPADAGCASATASARVSAACAPARVTSRVAAKPQPPPTRTRTPMPSDAELSIASIAPLTTAIASSRESTCRASAYAQRPSASSSDLSAGRAS